MTTTETGEVTQLGACPFCGAAIGVMRKEGQQAVAHGLPTCAKFESEDPLMFLHNVRMRTVGSLPDDDEWPLPIKQEPW
jgi:hypothetical protein